MLHASAIVLSLVGPAQATDNGIVRVYDRQLTCDHGVDPKADPRSCRAVVRKTPPNDERPTWAISIAPPGKLFYSVHTAAIDWGHVYRIDTKRAFDPYLLSVGITDDAEVCPDEHLVYLHSMSERGKLTHQICAKFDWEGHAEVLLESHRKLPTDMWVPVWGWRPDDDDAAADVKNWFIVQMWISTTGAAPERPAQHPYVSPAVLKAWVPKPLPMRKRLRVMGPEPEPEVDADSEFGDGANDGAGDAP